MDLKHKNKKNPAHNASRSDAGGPGEIALGSHFMKRKNISQGGKTKALFMVLFFAFSFAIFSSNTDTAEAVSQSACKGEGASWNASAGTCVCSDASGQKRVFDEYKGGCAFADSVATGVTGNNPYKNDGSNAGAAAGLPGAGTKGLNGENIKSCGKDSLLMCTFKELLMGIFNLCGWLFAIASTLFAWAIDPVSVSGTNGVLNKQAIKDVWIMVRDLLNMTFILVLLFAAFCTIFQVDKWNLKKVWLNILINSLLVNFSFPIARFIIDISNVAFYYFVNHLFQSGGVVTGNAIFAGLNASSKLGELLAPGDYSDYSVAYLVAMIVVVFIMGMTLMVVAGLFVVRLVALAMLIMFSPVGFVGYIFPSTSSYADDWWKKLFNYSFFAPIMIFIMAISLRITEALGKENFQPFISNASTNAPAGQVTWIASAAFYAIPIIILWMGIGVAKSFGIAGADTVVNGVKKGGKWLANAPGHYSGVYGATKKAKEDFDKKGKLFGKKIPFMGTETREQREARWSGGITGGRKGYEGAKKKIEDTKIADRMKEYKDRNYTADIIAKDLDSKNSHESMAAVKALISDKTAMSNPEVLQKVLEKSGTNFELRHRAIDAAENVADSDKLDHIKLNSVLHAATAGMTVGSDEEKAISGKIKGKVRKENVKKLLNYEMTFNKGGRTNSQIYEEELNKLNPESFGKQKKLHEDITTDVALQNYVSRHYANSNNKAAHQEAFGKMTNKARAAWATNPTFIP
ncbi:MAG: hypothetical protein ACD_56C00039G0001 [uncultured bacterium]|nr:MAG: hypothetical protein ACD_56C00039G0001 [uncultured bacterium]